MKIIKILSFIISFSVFAEIPHIRVLFHEDPSHEATIAFTQKGSKDEKGEVFVSEKPGTCSFELNSLKVTNINRLYHGEKNNWLHAVNLTGLKPDTTYYFCIKNDGQTSVEYNFVTTPSDPNAQVFFLFGGDSRSERENRIRINKSIRELFEKNPKIYALVHGGDMIWDGKDFEEFSEWMDDHMLTSTSNHRLLPLIVTQGNHESDEKLFSDIFVLEGNLSDAYYVTKIGKTAIFNLNSNISAGGDQLAWFEAKLKEITPNTKWLFANYHRPAYPAVKTPGSAKKFWVPVFEKYQFDLIFESDGHVLKKTVPIFKDELNMDKGIIYVGEGGLGVKLRTPDTDRWYLQAPGYAESLHHYFLIEVNENQVKVEVLKEGNSVFDTFFLKPRVRPL
jgi:acid phosphatase type 7